MTFAPQLCSSSDDSLKDKTRLLLIGVGALVIWYTFVPIHITSVVKSLLFLMTRSRVSKSCLKPELSLHRYEQFFCLLLSIFGFQYKHYSSD